jgi:hypothetical protein
MDMKHRVRRTPFLRVLQLEVCSRDTIELVLFRETVNDRFKRLFVVQVQDLPHAVGTNLGYSEPTDFGTHVGLVAPSLLRQFRPQLVIKFLSKICFRLFQHFFIVRMHPTPDLVMKWIYTHFSVRLCTFGW